MLDYFKWFIIIRPMFFHFERFHATAYIKAIFNMRMFGYLLGSTWSPLATCFEPRLVYLLIKSFSTPTSGDLRVCHGWIGWSAPRGFFRRHPLARRERRPHGTRAHTRYGGLRRGQVDFGRGGHSGVRIFLVFNSNSLPHVVRFDGTMW
jgi:hypothetical protein